MNTSLTGFFSLADDSSSARRWFVPRHLDSPLIADGLQDDIDDVQQGRPRTRSGANLNRTLQRLSNAIGRHASTTVLCAGLSLATPTTLLDLINTVEGRNKIDTQADEWAAGVFAHVAPLFHVKTDQIRRSVGVDQPFNVYYRREYELDLVLDRLDIAQSNGSKQACVGRFPHPVWRWSAMSDKHVVLTLGDGSQSMFMSLDMFLCVKDMCGVRARSLHAAFCLYDTDKMVQLLERQTRWQEGLIKCYGNQGFELAKYTEALSKAYLTKLTSLAFRDVGPYEKISAKFLEKASTMSPIDNRCSQPGNSQLEAYTEILADSNIQEVVELFGVQKTVGHPFIYAAIGGKSASKEALTTWPYDADSIHNLRSSWAAIFSIGYIKRHKRWPRLIFDPPIQSTVLYKWYSAGYLPGSTSQFVLNDWRTCRFGKMFDFNYHENFLDLIDDKAISYKRSEMAAYWDSNVATTSERRLLLEVFSREEVDIKKIVDRVDADRVPQDWKVVSLYPKEKEMKTAARMFSMMTMEMRCFFNCSESNLAESIFPYLDPQTMTLEKTQITSKFYQFTTPISTSNTYRLLIECDLSRWNLRWRGAHVHHIGSDLNDLFGLRGVYTQVHKFFQESVIVVRTPRLRPEGIELMYPPQSDLVWYSHLGGFEGIAQKHWTICTYAMIDAVMSRLPCSYKLLGQGDNQILFVEAEINPDEDETITKQRMVDTITRELSLGCAAVNQDLKGEECLESDTVITYSKNIFVNGAEFFTRCKFLSRLWARTSDEIPSISADFAGLSAAAQSAAEFALQPYVAYYMFLYCFFIEWTRRVTRDHSEWKSVPASLLRRVRQWRGDHLARLVLIPSAIGGLPIGGPGSFVYRGSGDVPGRELCALLALSRSSPLCARIIASITNGDWFDSTSSPYRLLEDPYAFPSRRSIAGSATYQQMIDRYLSSNVKTESLKVLHSAEVEEYAEELRTCLMTITPFDPTLAQMIYSQSFVSELSRLRKMFSSTRTVQVASRATGYDASTAIILASGGDLVVLFETLSSLGLYSTVRSVTLGEGYRWINTLRDQWEACYTHHGLPWSGIQGLTVYSPFLAEIKIADTPTTDNGIKLAGVISADSLTTRGRERAYLGAKTQMKRSEYGYKLLSNSAPVAAIKGLARLHTYDIGSDPLKFLLRVLATHRGPINIEEAHLYGRPYGGIIDHRLHSSMQDRGAYVLGFGNLTTHMFFSSDECLPLSGSAIDYAFMVQEWMCHLTYVASVCCTTLKAGSSYVELVALVDPSEITPLPVSKYDLGFLPDLHVPDAVITSPMLYTHDLGAINLVGAFAIRNTASLITPEEIPHQDVIMSALVSWLSRNTPISNPERALQDSVISDVPRLGIDLPELMNLQSLRLVDAAARVVLLLASHQWLSDMRRDIRVVDHSLDRSRAAFHLAAMLDQMFMYHRMLEDPTAPQSGLYTRYIHGKQYPTSRQHLAGMIMDRAEQLMNSPFEFLKSHYVLASQPGGTVSAVLWARLGFALNWYYNHDGHLGIVHAVALNPLLDRVAQTFEESARCRMLVRLVTGWVRMKTTPASLRKLLHEAATQDSVRVLAADDRECLRLARMFCLPSVSPMTMSHPLFRSVIREIDPGLRPLGVIPPDLSDLIWRSSYNHIRIGKHYNCWYHSILSLHPRTVYLLGVGAGVAARAALDAGVEQVIGRDLLECYDVSRLRAEYPPPAVAGSASARKYRWDRSMFGGASTLSPINPALEDIGAVPAGALIIIDIQPFDNYQLLVSNLHKLDYACWCLVRLKIPEQYATETVARLARAIDFNRMFVYSCGDQIWAHVILTPGRTGDSGSLTAVSFRTNERITWSGVPNVTTLLPVFLTEIYRNASIAVFGQTILPDAFAQIRSKLCKRCGRSLKSVDYQMWTKTLNQIGYLDLLARERIDPQTLHDYLSVDPVYVRIRDDFIERIHDPSLYRTWIKNYYYVMSDARYRM